MYAIRSYYEDGGIDVSALDDSDEDIIENRCTITLL